MNLTTLLLLEGAFLLTCGLLFFNQRFRDRFFMTAWKLKFFVIVPLIFVGLVYGLGGSAGVSSVVPQAFILILTLLQALLFSLFQIFIMFWAMGRPQVDWYFPGDAPDLDWSDWIGSEEVKKEAMKMVESLERWKDYEKAGTKPANGAIFYGPPGTGKSLLAKVIASKAKMPVCIAASASLNGPFVAMGMLIVKALGRKIRKYADQYGGCVAFLDEIDAIGLSRGTQGGGGMLGGSGFMMGGGGMGGNGTLQSLLTEMSGATDGQTWTMKLMKRWGLRKGGKKNWRILWIAATNVDLKMLDPALIRAGRFGSIKLYIGNPNDVARVALFKHYLRKKTLAKDIDFDQLKQLSRGMTGADIEETCEAAARTVVYESENESLEIGFEALWKQLRFHKFGPPSPVDLHESAKRPVALHEAGHGAAVVDYSPTGWLCSGATLRPREDFLAAVFREKEVEEFQMSNYEDCLRSILIAVNSRAVEEHICKTKYTGTSSDFNQAMNMALMMVTIAGMGEKITSRLATGGGLSPKHIAEAERIVNAVYRFAQRYTAEREDAINALADSLVEKIDLTGPQVIDIIQKFGKPKVEFIAPEIDKIIEEMKAEEKAERAEMAALARGHEGDVPAAPALPAPVEGTDGITALAGRAL